MAEPAAAAREDNRPGKDSASRIHKGYRPALLVDTQDIGTGRKRQAFAVFGNADGSLLPICLQDSIALHKRLRELPVG